MICHCCGEPMKNVDDVNDVSVRIDWERCPKCNSFAEIEYGVTTKHVEKVLWKRNYNWER